MASSSTAMRLELGLWAGASRMGAPMVGFLPLKTPIECDGLELDEEHAFTVSLFMEKQTSEGRSVGLCIDLTSPQPSGQRLYDTEEWSRDWDVQYLALPCAPPLPEAGNAAAWAEAVPDEEAVGTFIKKVEAFWAEPGNQKRYIAVHCVTGVNLTGYMIARYGMRNVPLARVLALFGTQRKPGVYAPDLLDALWQRAPAAAESVNDGWTQPAPPAWHPLAPRTIVRPKPPSPRSLEAQRRVKPAVPLFNDPPPAAGAKRPAAAAPLAADAASAAGGSAATAAAKFAQPPAKAARTGSGSAEDGDSLAGVRSVGEPLAAAEAARLRRSCATLVLGSQANGGPSGPEGADVLETEGGLPCACQSAPLRPAHLELLGRAGGNGRLVTWIPEGARCVLYVLTDDAAPSATRSVLFDAQGGAWQLGAMAWPKPAAAAGDSGGSHAPLVLAGELVCDRDGSTASGVWRLLCSDVLCLGGRSIISQPLHKRLALLDAEVIKPRRTVASVASELLRVRLKECFRLKYVPYLLSKFVPKLTHPARGLVFLDADAPFTAGASERALDWERAPPASAEGAAGEVVGEAELVAYAEANFK